jgi:hypothetical protein
VVEREGVGLPASRRSVLLAIALLLLLAGAGVTVFGVAARESGRSRLSGILAEHAANGWGTSYADLVRSAPPVDRALQDRAWIWMKEGARATGGEVRYLGQAVDWAFADPPSAPEGYLAAHEAFRDQAQALGAMLATGHLCLTSLGWIDVTPEEAEDVPLSRRAALHIPNLLAVRAAEAWFVGEALLADDPATSLEVLDRLRDALSRPGCLIDAMIAIATDAQRDEAFLALVLLGRLDAARREAWLGEPVRAAALCADGWRGERLLFAAPLAQDLLRGVSLAEHFGGEAEIEDADDFWRWRVRPLFRASSDAATYIEGMTAFERYLRGTLDAKSTRAAMAPMEDLGTPFDLMTPNREAMLSSVVNAQTEKRSTQVAAAIVVACREHGTVPRDRDEARLWLGPRAALMDATAFSLALRYEPMDDGRFRIAPDPHGRLPALLDATDAVLFPQAPTGSWPEDRVFRRTGATVDIRLP